MLDRLAPTEATLLIIGETGTGKEMAARYVHARSQRRSGPFLAVNCGALSDTLAEAELFGHEKGAFTGAVRAERGWFEAASGGTLLLDEIGDLPLNLQVKLLRVLQEREVTRLGSRSATPIDVRVIAATNVDLHAAIAAKRFREDLYFRLNVATVILPPLRERCAGLPSLIQHFLKLYGDRLGRPNLRIGPEALVRLSRHLWPGNIRELENVIHNAVLLAKGEMIETADLRIAAAADDALEAPALERKLRLLFETYIQEKEPQLFHRVAQTLVQTAFDLADSNQVRAAQSLSISRNALRTQLAHLGVIQARRRGAVELPGPARAARLKELRVGYQIFGMLNILKADGMFESRLAANGTSVRWIGFSAGPQLLAALQADDIDLGATGDVPPIYAQANGAPLVYTAYEPPAPQNVAVVVPRGSRIRDVAGLRGKRLVFNQWSNVHYLVVRGLEAHGLGLQDLTIVHAPPEESRLVLARDQADAWALWDPLLTIAQRSREVRVLFDGRGLVMNHEFHLARRDFAAAHPDIISLSHEELRRIGRRLGAQALETARAVSPKMGIDVPTLEIMFKRLTHGTRRIDQNVVWEQQKIADRFYALGLIGKPISVRDAVWPAV
jgi:aliphatic sulfonates family ABC transporter substrate-binding protein